MTTIQLQLFSSFQLRHNDEQLVPLRQNRLQSLLAYIALHRDAPHPRQHLAFLFWPDSQEAQAYTNLRKALSTLRTTLPNLEDFLYTDSRVVQWHPDAQLTLDVTQFEHYLAAAEQAAHRKVQPDVVSNLVAAVQLYGGDLLPACYDDWIVPERERLRERFLDALSQLSEELEQTRAYPQAIHYANRLLRTDPLHEATYRRLMRLHLLNNDRVSALRSYHACADILQRELGVEPSPLTQEIYAQLLQLDATPIQPIRQAKPDHNALVGRQREWQQLTIAWKQAASGQLRFMLVGGDPGIGKTRLTEELLAWVGQQGFATAYARTYAAEGRMAFDPVAEWLRSASLQRRIHHLDAHWQVELARLLPELLSEHSALLQPLTEGWQRRRFFEALVHAVLSDPEPLLLVLDDMQWCDEETIEWLHYLLRFDPHARLLVVATVRPGEIDPEHPLILFLNELRRADRIVMLELSSLSQEEAGQLVHQMADHPLDAAALESLYQETEGNPLFLVEMLRAGRGNPDVFPPAPFSFSSPFGVPPSIPPRLQSVIESRLAQLSPTARNLIELAATVGRSFTFDLLYGLYGASRDSEDSLVAGLDELWRRRIVREQTTGHYDFSHDKIREVVYGGISAARRRLLHRQVAEAIKRVYSPVLDAVALQLAFHCEHSHQMEAAVVYYQQAAGIARRMYAFREVIHCLDRAIALLQMLPQTLATQEQKLDVWAELGTAWSIVKSCAAPEAVEAYTQALELCQKFPHTPHLFAVLWGLHQAFIYRGENQKALQLAQRCLKIAQNGDDDALLLEAHHAMWGTYFFQGSFVAAIEHAEQGLALYNQAEHQKLAIHYGAHDPGICALELSGMALWLLGYPEQAEHRLNRILESVRDTSIPASAADAYAYSAVLFQLLGDVEATLQWAEKAVELATEQESAYSRSMGLILAGWAETRLGNAEEGLRRLHEGLAEYTAAGMFYQQIYLYSLLAEAYYAADRVEDGLRATASGQAIAQKCEDRFYLPELYRLHGLLQLVYAELQGGSSVEGEAWYRQSLESARQQQAKSLELRTSLSLGRLWAAQGKRKEALELLVPICAWFTEGFNSPDLQEAQSLLADLGA